MKNLFTLHSRMSRIIVTVLLLSFVTIQTNAQCIPTNTVVNGTFNTDLTGWTANPFGDGVGWYRIGADGGFAGIEKNNIVGILSQNLTNLDKAVRVGGKIPLTLEVGAQDYNNAGGNTAKLEIRLGGTLYATITNASPRNTANVTIAYANGATGNFVTFGTSGKTAYTKKTFTLDIPYSGPASAVLAFRADLDGDDWGLDNISLPVLICADISGNVFNDVNGNTDNKVNGVLYTTTGLNAVLVDNTSGKVVAISAVTGGTYNFQSQNIGSYSVWITTNTATVGNTPPAIALPAGFVSTGEFNGAGPGNDGTADGKIDLGTVNSAITQVNFGIEQPPTAGSGVINNVANLGGTTQFTVPGNTFTNTTVSSDPSPGEVTGIRITAFPGLATSIVIDGVTYTVGVPADETALTALIISTDASGAPTVPITVDPTDDGVTFVTISFVAVDAAGKESTNTDNEAGTAKINFSDAVPNLSPVIAFVPNNITNTTDIGVVLSVYEFNSVSTSGLITVLIQKDPKYVLAFNPTATSVFGRAVSNASWTFDPSSNSSFYVLTTTAVIPADGVLQVGFTTTFNPNNTMGSTPIFSIILEGSGSETYDLDNTSFDRLTYKIQ